MMSDRVLRNDSINGLCTLTLNRPDKLNALDTQSFEELNAHLSVLEGETDRVGCVVLRGAGRGFCAGADLNAIGAAPVSPAFKPGVIERLNRLPQPVIVAVHGVCFTGGLELALACDFICADASARFSDTHGKWGLVSAWGMSQRLPRRIGLSAAKRMMMTGHTLDAISAHSIGLVDLLAPENGLDELIAFISTEILANSWHTNLSTKRIMRETDGMSLEAGIAHENFRYPGNAPDHHERIARFGKK